MGGVQGSRGPYVPEQPFLPTFDGAACEGMDTNLFFYDVRGRYNAYSVRKAKNICKQCPIIDRCLQFAMDLPDIHGIWGGTTDTERIELRRMVNSA